jgi:uncharacterized protein (UPF0335 family)
MSKLEILKFEIKNKLIFIEEQMLKSKKSDNQVTDKIPDYLDEISRLEKENTDLKAQSKQLDQEHSKDLKKVENLVFELSKLMENNNA